MDVMEMAVDCPRQDSILMVLTDEDAKARMISQPTAG